MATIGAVSNPDNIERIDRQGRSSPLARPSPHNRGVAMNPVDHPHGGGEGRTSGGRHPVTPWGKPTKGNKTRNNKRTDQVHRPPPHTQEVRADAMARSIWKGPFVDGYSAEEGRRRARSGRSEVIKIWCAPLDHPAAVRRPDLRRLQRPEAHSGAW
jgi:hypothetical protein